MHTHPEGGFKEFRTQKLLRDTLKSYGIEDKFIKDCAGTGLVVDLLGRAKGAGKAAKSEDGPISMVALRADMDGLPIPENSPDLPYRTQTDHAHMCGHDGHMAILLAAAEVLAKRRD